MDPIKPKTTTIPPAISEPKPEAQRPRQAEDRIEGSATIQRPNAPLAVGDAVSEEIVARFAALVESMGEINGDIAERGDVDIEV